MTTEYLIARELNHVFAALMPTNALVCRVALETGLRISDVLSLKTDNLRAQMYIVEAKTGKKRRVNFRQTTLNDMLSQAGKIWVFESSKDPNKHRTRQAVWHDVKRAAKAFRLPQNVAPHSLRKCFAVDKLDAAHGDITKVQRALNHTDAATTMIYAMARQLYESKYCRGQQSERRSHRAAR